MLSLFAGALSAADTINAAGATFPAPIYQKWFEEYKAKTGIQVNYQPVGSGAGRAGCRAARVPGWRPLPPVGGHNCPLMGVRLPLWAVPVHHREHDCAHPARSVDGGAGSCLVAHS